MLPAREPLEKYRPKVWAICFRMLGSAADADDLVQETFVRALERPPADTARSIEPWLVTVAINLARDALRRRRRGRYDGPWLPSPVDAALAGGAGSTDEPDRRYEIVERLSFGFLVALERLTPNQRAVLVLRDALEYTATETARALGMTEGNVKVTLHRARQALGDVRAFEQSAAPREIAEQTVSRFAMALAAGDTDALLALLTEDVVNVQDAGGVLRAARKILVGAEKVAKLFFGLVKRRPELASPVSATLRTILGRPALVLELPVGPPREAERMVILFDVGASGKVRRIDSVIAPRKLTHVRFG